MSYSFDYTTLPILGPNNLGYLYPTTPPTTPTTFPTTPLEFGNNAASNIVQFNSVPPGVYLFNSTGYVQGSIGTTAYAQSLYKWTLALSPVSATIGSSSYCSTQIVGGQLYSEYSDDYYPYGAGFSLCNTFNITTTQTLYFVIFPNLVSENTPPTPPPTTTDITTLLWNTFSLCRIA
jgi:hypothetical protein